MEDSFIKKKHPWRGNNLRMRKHDVYKVDKVFCALPFQ